MDDSNLLLWLLAEAMKNGLRDANGSLSKLNVENFILHRLNAKTRFSKTYKCSVDYDDLQLVVGVGTTTGNDSMPLGVDDTYTSILENEENTISEMEKFPYDATSNAFMAPQNNIFDLSFQPQSPIQPSSRFEATLGSMFNKEKIGQEKAKQIRV
ncbi:hypothetical protein Ddye_030977 [Dipteronia dyeriana]|uniref:Uncharacterized protein n=1 Tax=Dipteronia dyeriana TaxID=168575 RepID=A0AAD9THE7_9ROSI|nr:hypothetical protein Ddye_030977 [Dipteronia dyeriana]